jgi:hypothetical protein
MSMARDVSSAAAIDTARRALVGKINLPADTPVTTERRGGHWVVTFPLALPPGTKGADYYARVTIDATSGEVVEILGGA